MRKVSIFASAIALTVALASCSNKTEGDNAAETEAPTEAPAQSEVKLNSRETTLAQYIRYIDTQKISANYAPALEVAKADSAASVKLVSYQNQLAADLQKKQKAIEDKQSRNGYLTQESFNADLAALQKASQDAENKIMQRQRDYAVEIANKQEAVLDSIHSVINFLSEKYQLDAVMDKSVGYYFNPALDITDEVIAELNRRLKVGK